MCSEFRIDADIASHLVHENDAFIFVNHKLRAPFMGPAKSPHEPDAQ